MGWSHHAHRRSVCINSGRQKKASRTGRRRTFAAVQAMEPRIFLSTYFVSASSGNNSNSGTFAQPFATIQQAANVAQWGDTVEIEAGIYHEMVTPASSGVTFTNYNGESVTISGADPVGNFVQQAGGSIYTTQLSATQNLANDSSATYAALGTNLSSQLGTSQIFVDGQLMTEARWPNTGSNLLDPTDAHVQSASGNTIFDSNLTQPAGYWDGATIHITTGEGMSPSTGWVAYTGTVINSGVGWLTISLPTGADVPVTGSPYYLSGKLSQLDGAGQYFIDSSNALSLWDPNGDNPNSHDVEVRTRVYAFELANVSNTTIEGINLFAAGIDSNVFSANTFIDGINAKYVSQGGAITNGWDSPGDSPGLPAGTGGIALNGAFSTLENSTVAYSAGDGVFVNAPDCTVTGNVIHDVDYAATDAAAIREQAYNETITGNVIYDTGRDAINLNGSVLSDYWNVTNSNNIVSGNTIYSFGLLTADVGGIYTASDLAGGTISNNTIYGAHATIPTDYSSVGIFLDNDSAGFTVVGNVTSDVDTGIKLNGTAINDLFQSNSLGASRFAIEDNGFFSWQGTLFKNNVYYSPNLEMGTGYTETGDTFVNDTAYGSSAAPPSNNQNVFDTPSVGGVELGMQFQVDEAGTIAGVRFWKGTLNSGVHTGELWSSSGQLLATATFANESSSGWQQVNFANPVSVQPGQTYTVSYHSTSGYLSYTPHALASGIDAFPFEVPGGNAKAGAAVYHLDSAGGGEFPSLYNGQAGTYWVDAVFNPALPQLDSILSDASPTLSAQNIYDPATAANGGSELGVEFTSSVAGLVSGVEFWKSSDVTGTQTGELWSAAGQLLASVTFTNETTSGWQVAMFAQPIAIPANTTFIISYHTNSPYLTYTPGALVSAVVSGPLTALASSPAGGNDVYSYGTNPIVPQSYNGQSALYWVDVLFQPAGN